MTGKSLRLTRMLVSKKFAPPKSADERALEFLASKKEIVSKSFDAELSVKALGKNTGKKPPSADNKEKRKKGKGPNKRFGLAVFDPNAKKKTGQIFIPWIAQWGRTGSDEYPNFGWIDPIKELKPNQTNARMFQASEKKKNGVSVTYSDVVRNPRTGEFDTKSLGRTIGQLVPGGEIATRAASALGLWQDSAGKLRCPPGVPAANQFTDSSGSNCFDITEGMASRLLRSAINSNLSLMDDMSLLNEAISFERVVPIDGRTTRYPEKRYDSLYDIVRGLASSKPRAEYSDGKRTVWLPTDDTDLIDEAGVEGFKPTGRVDAPASTRPIIKVDAVPEEPKSADDLIGPDSLPISRIDAKSFAEEVRARVIDAHPDITPEELDRIVMLAEQKARMTDALNGRIDVALQLMKDLGIDVDPSSPQSVSAGFMRAMDELSKSGWDINFENTLWTDVDRTLSREEQVAQHHANVLNMIVQNMVKDPEGTLEARDASVVKRLWAGLSKKKKEEAVRNATMAYLNGDAPETLKTDLEKALHRNMAHRMNNYLAAEHGFMLGMLAEHKMNPGKAELLKRVGVMDPMDPRNEGLEAMVIPDADGQISMLWNPLGMILADNPPAPRNPKAWRLYGTSGSGLEVSKIAEVKKAVDSATKMAMLNDMLGGDVFDAIKTHGYMGDIAKKHGGSIGHAMFVFQHELTHAQQYAMVMYMISHDKKGRRITTLSNVELAKLADDIITGNFPGLTMEMLFADEKAMAAVHGKVGVVMDSMVREGMSGIYPRMHLETMHILNKIMGLKDDDRPGFISDLEDRFATLRERAGFDKDLTPDEQMELKILNHAIGTIRGIDEFDDEQLQNSVRTQRALMFAESAAELNAARAMGIIDPTDEKVTAALAHLDAPMDKVAKEVVAVKESKKRKWLERLVGAVEMYDELKNSEWSLEQASSGDEPLTINLVRRKRWREGSEMVVSESVAELFTVSLEESSGIPRGFSKLTPEGEYEPLRAGDMRGFVESILSAGVEKTKPFKGRASARSHGKKMRDDLMATATPMEISAMEKTMPERMDGRILTSPAHVSYSVAESAKIRKGLASGKTFDKRIEEDIAPLLSVMDRHTLDDDYTVMMDMDIPGREGLVAGSSVEVSNMFRGIIADQKTVLTPTREESGTRMVLMLPRGTSAIPDEDFIPGRNKEKSYSALLMPPGKIEVVGRQDDGTIVARLVEQASPNEVLSSMRGPLEEIIANPNISASRKMEAQKAINAIDAARSINLPVGKRGDDRVARMSSVGLSSAKDRIGAKSHKYFDDALKQVEEAASTWQGMNPSTKNAIKYGTTIAMTASSAWLGRKNTKISNWMDDFDEHEIDFAEELLNVWDAGGPTLTAHTIASTKNMIYQAQDRFEKSGMRGSDFRAQVDDMFNGIKKDITEKLANGNRRLGEMSTKLRTDFMEKIDRALSSLKKEKVDAGEVVEIERDLGRGLASRRGYSTNTPSTKPPTGLASQKHPGIKRLANVVPLRAEKEGAADTDELDTVKVSSLLKDEILTDIFDMAEDTAPPTTAKWIKLRKEALAKPGEKIGYQDKEVLASEAKRMVSAHIGDALSEQFTIEELSEAGKYQESDMLPSYVDTNIFQTISDIVDSYKNGNGEPVTFWYVPETGTIEKVRFRGTDGEYEPYTSDYIEFSYPSDEGNKALYDFAASTLVKQWQITSNDSNVTSLRVQDVAREIFELNDSLGWRLSTRLTNRESAVLNPEEHVSLPISDAQKKLLTVFLNAQYAQTQEYLNKKGIKKLTVYRGFTDDALEYSLSNNGNFPEDGITDAELELRPLSSFSVDPGIAWAFGQLVIESEIDAKDIIALPLTGSGCLNESEVIVLGRSGLTGTIRAKQDFAKRMAEIQAAKTSAAQLAELDKFAEDLSDIPPPPDWTTDF